MGLCACVGFVYYWSGCVLDAFVGVFSLGRSLGWALNQSEQKSSAQKDFLEASRSVTSRTCSTLMNALTVYRLRFVIYGQIVGHSGCSVDLSRMGLALRRKWDGGKANQTLRRQDLTLNAIKSLCTYLDHIPVQVAMRRHRCRVIFVLIFDVPTFLPSFPASIVFGVAILAAFDFVAAIIRIQTRALSADALRAPASSVFNNTAFLQKYTFYIYALFLKNGSQIPITFLELKGNPGRSIQPHIRRVKYPRGSSGRYMESIIDAMIAFSSG